MLVSNENGAGLYLFTSMQKGWDRQVFSQKGDAANRLPPIARKGENMGAWIHSRHVWWQNEHTALLQNLVDRRSFNQLLENVEPTAKAPEASLQSIKAVALVNGFWHMGEFGALYRDLFGETPLQTLSAGRNRLGGLP